MSILNTFLSPLTGDVIRDAKRIVEWSSWSVQEVLDLEKTIQNPQDFLTYLFSLNPGSITPLPWQREALDSLLSGHNHVISHARQIGMTTLLQCFVIIKTAQSSPDILFMSPRRGPWNFHEGMMAYQETMPYFLTDMKIVPDCGNDRRGPFSHNHIWYKNQIPRGMEFDLVIIDEAEWVNWNLGSLLPLRAGQTIICSTVTGEECAFKDLITNPPGHWKAIKYPYHHGHYSPEMVDRFREAFGEEAFRREMLCNGQ